MDPRINVPFTWVPQEQFSSHEEHIFYLIKGKQGRIELSRLHPQKKVLLNVIRRQNIVWVWLCMNALKKSTTSDPHRLKGEGASLVQSQWNLPDKQEQIQNEFCSAFIFGCSHHEWWKAGPIFVSDWLQGTNNRRSHRMRTGAVYNASVSRCVVWESRLLLPTTLTAKQRAAPILSKPKSRWLIKSNAELRSHKGQEVQVDLWSFTCCFVFFMRSREIISPVQLRYHTHSPT